MLRHSKATMYVLGRRSSHIPNSGKLLWWSLKTSGAGRRYETAGVRTLDRMTKFRQKIIYIKFVYFLVRKNNFLFWWYTLDYIKLVFLLVWKITLGITQLLIFGKPFLPTHHFYLIKDMNIPQLSLNRTIALNYLFSTHTILY